MTTKAHNREINIPILFAATKEQKTMIREPPRYSLKKVREGKGTGTDWYNLMFRIRSAKHIAQRTYEKPTQDQINEVYNALMAVMDRAVKVDATNPVYIYTAEELNLIEAGLDAMDAMEDQVMRRLLLEAMHIAKKHNEKFLKK